MGFSNGLRRVAWRRLPRVNSELWPPTSDLRGVHGGGAEGGVYPVPAGRVPGPRGSVVLRVRGLLRRPEHRRSLRSGLRQRPEELLGNLSVPERTQWWETEQGFGEGNVTQRATSLPKKAASNRPSATKMDYTSLLSWTTSQGRNKRLWSSLRSEKCTLFTGQSKTEKKPNRDTDSFYLSWLTHYVSIGLSVYKLEYRIFKMLFAWCQAVCYDVYR